MKDRQDFIDAAAIAAMQTMLSAKTLGIPSAPLTEERAIADILISQYPHTEDVFGELAVTSWEIAQAMLDARDEDTAV